VDCSRGAAIASARPWASTIRSKEGLFIANNVLFVGFAVVVLLGTVFPLLYEAVNGGQVTVGTPYFATVAVPMSIVLLVLMSLAPLVGWRTWTRGAVVATSLQRLGVALRRRRVDLAGVRRPMVLLAYFWRRRPRERRCEHCAAPSSRRSVVISVGTTRFATSAGNGRAPRRRRDGARDRDLDVVHDAQRSDAGDRTEHRGLRSVRHVHGFRT